MLEYSTNFGKCPSLKTFLSVSLRLNYCLYAHVHVPSRKKLVFKQVKNRVSFMIVTSLKYKTLSKYLLKYTSECLFHDLCDKMEILSSNILNNGVQQVKGWQFELLCNLSENKKYYIITSNTQCMFPNTFILQHMQENTQQLFLA